MEEGQAAALEPWSRRPRTGPAQLFAEVKEKAIGVRAALEHSESSRGSISVHEKTRALGMDPVPAADLPARRRGAVEPLGEASGVVPTVRLSGAERLLVP